jgi:hypothetical protein
MERSKTSTLASTPLEHKWLSGTIVGKFNRLGCLTNFAGIYRDERFESEAVRLMFVEFQRGRKL